MNIINKVLLDGYVCDPEFKINSANRLIVNFVLSTYSPILIIKDKEPIEWDHYIIYAVGLLAKECRKHLKDGYKVLVTGWLKSLSDHVIIFAKDIQFTKKYILNNIPSEGRTDKKF